MLNIKNAKIRNTSESLGRFLRGRERMVHVSALIVDHPLFLHAVKQGAASTYQGPRFEVGSTNTARKGHNASKRHRRHALIAAAGSVRAGRRHLSQLKASAHA